jgi:hypothetical protein
VIQIAASWGDLKSLRAWTPLTALPHPSQHLGGTLFQLAGRQYLICPAANERFERPPGIPGFVVGLLWAQSEGAARRAILKAVDADPPDLRPLPEPPPAELLLPGSGDTYGSIVTHLRAQRPTKFIESATYRVGTDGAFVHRTIGAAPFTFFFRNRKGDDDDRCYAIEYRLAGYAKAAEYARSLAEERRSGSKVS